MASSPIPYFPFMTLGEIKTFYATTEKKSNVSVVERSIMCSQHNILFYCMIRIVSCIFDVSDFAESMKNKVVKLDFC